MKHLSESELVDLAEDALDSGRAAHVRSCASCREQAEALRAVLRDSARIAVPEPSPLFWEHLSARVREDVAETSAPHRAGWSWPAMRSLMPMGAAVAVVVAVFSGVLVLRGVRHGAAPSPTVTAPVAVTQDAGPPTTPDADNAAVWDVLTSAASTVGFDEAHAAGLHVRPAAIDHAVQDLSAAELNELGRLLQSELNRSSN